MKPNGHGSMHSSDRDSLTQQQTAVFQTQNNGSFQMRFDPVIYIHGGLGLLYLHLPPIAINVTVGRFVFMLYKSGPKPSKEIDLGFVYQHASGNYVYRCVWQTDGRISLRTGVTAGDYLQPASFILPIPDGVTFG